MSSDVIAMLDQGDPREAHLSAHLSLSLDADARVMWCSTGVEVLVGRSLESLRGRTLWELLDPLEVHDRASAADVPVGPELLLADPTRFDRRRGSAPDLGKLDRRSSSGRRSPGAGPRRACSWTVIGAHGARTQVSLTVHPLLDTDGLVMGFVVVGTDATVERATSDILAQALLSEQEAAQRLAEINELRDDFVTTASHEIRTPLTNILGFVELLAEGTDAERRTLALSAIRRNAERLRDLADSLVIVAADNVPAGSSTHVVDLRHVVSKVMSALCDEAAGQGVALLCDLPAHPVLTRGNRSRLELVVRNLLTNALGFSSPGDEVSCDLEQGVGEAVLRVIDTGKGIPPAELEHIFEPFFRGAAAHEAVPGRGLGLSTAAAVVRMHHGHLEATPNAPRGSVFTVRLPLHPEETTVRELVRR